MRPERRDPNEVCDGIRALKGLLKGDPEAILTDEDLRLDQPDLPPGDPAFPLTQDQRIALKLLHLALDTYGDLLMADGALQIVNRQVERAAESMDAASGFTRPPTFEFIRTPPSGYQLETRVLTTLPFVPSANVPADDSPCRIAEPSITTLVENRLGRDWRWTVLNQDKDNAVLASAGLGDLGFTPSDALALSTDFMSDAARIKLGFPLIYISEGRNRRWVALDNAGQVVAATTLVQWGLPPEELGKLGDDELQQRLRAKLGVPADAVIREDVLAEPRMWIAKDEYGRLLGMVALPDLGLTPEQLNAAPQTELYRRVRAQLGLAQVRVEPPREHTLARLLAASLGSRPACGRDLVADTALQRAADATVRAELVERYQKLYDACDGAIQQLGNAADDAARSAALRRSLGWGITPIADPHDLAALLAALFGAPPPPEASPLSSLVEQAKQSLQDRLKRVPPRDDPPAASDALARAIATLASPDGKLSVLARWETANLLAQTRLQTQQPEASLDDQWLTIVAPVRPPLARFEALQIEARVLGAFAPFVAWTTSPGDPWRTKPDAVVRKNLNKRESSKPVAFDVSPLVAAYGVSEAWAGESVAVGLLDAFGEAIPMPQRTTTTAFGFNAPVARPPQAILLAVPPVTRQRLDSDLVLQIVLETRELAHARAVRVDDLGDLLTLMPTTWLQSSGAAAAHLEGWILFK
jgi:hypothetical protein